MPHTAPILTGDVPVLNLVTIMIAIMRRDDALPLYRIIVARYRIIVLSCYRVVASNYRNMASRYLNIALSCKSYIITSILSWPVSAAIQSCTHIIPGCTGSRESEISRCKASRWVCCVRGKTVHSMCITQSGRDVITRLLHTRLWMDVCV
jgi:hypothetical protein